MKYRFTKFILRMINNRMSKSNCNACFVFTNGKAIHYWASLKDEVDWKADINAAIEAVCKKSKKH